MRPTKVSAQFARGLPRIAAEIVYTVRNGGDSRRYADATHAVGDAGRPGCAGMCASGSEVDGRRTRLG